MYARFVPYAQPASAGSSGRRARRRRACRSSSTTCGVAIVKGSRAGRSAGESMTSFLRGETDPNATVVAALVVDLEDPHGPGAARGCEVRAAAGLSVEPDDLDDAHQAVGVRWRRHRAVADQARLSPRVVRGHVAVAHGQVLADHVVDRRLQGAPQPIVVGVGEIEIHPGGPVIVQLSAGDERAVELPEDDA